MGFSIVARCPTTGWTGIAISSELVGAGRFCESIQPNAGGAIVQGRMDPSLNRLAVALLAQGKSSHDVLQELLHSDPLHARRQIGLVDRHNQAAGFTGASSRDWAGHRTGEGYAVAGDDLAGPEVLAAMASACESRSGEALDERLMSALVAGRDAGGSRTAEQSAGIIAYGTARSVQLFLRVDLSSDATHELRRVFDRFKPYEADYQVRVDNPAQALGPDAIEAKIAADRSVPA